MNKWLLLLVLFAGSAGAQQLINCAPNTPCDPATGPSATNTGDKAWIAYGKTNLNWQNAGSIANVCAQSTACNGDTFWNIESISCNGTSGAGTTAVITGMAETPPASYIGAYAVVTGCGPASAQSANGQTVAAAGSGYAASVAPFAGDYIVASGGTPVNGSSFTGSIDHTTGILTVTAVGSGQIYLGQVLTVGGSNIGGVTLIQDFISGTGLTGTYQTTYVSGSDQASTTIVGTNRTVLRVLKVSAGAITYAGLAAGGQYSTAPSNPVTQGSTSGSGTGAQFTLTYSGLPISGTIASVQATGFTFNSGTNATTQYSSTNEQVAFGHYDDAAVTAALAANPIGLVFPPRPTPSWSPVPLSYGFQNPISLPNSRRFTMDCEGGRIIPLSPLNAQVTVPFQGTTTLFYNPIINNCELQGMGVANYNAYLSMARWTLENSALLNAVIENVYIGDGLGDGAANVTLSHVRVHNDTYVVPQWSAYNYELQASSDNQVDNSVMDTAMWGGMLINGADDQIRNVHLFLYGAGMGFDIEGTKTGIDGIVDNPAPGQAAYYVNSGLLNLHNGWQVSVNNTYQGQYGVYINNDGHSTIGCGTGANGTAWVGNTANLVFFNVTQVTNRVLPCTGNGTSDPPVFTGNLTVTGAAAVSGAATVGGTLGVTGAITATGGVSGAVAATTVSASGLISPSTTVGVKGTTAADAAQAGSIGEVMSNNCPSNNTATVTFSTTSPRLTWSAPPWTQSSPAPTAWTCAVNFTNSGGALPSGLSASTTYWVVPISGTTFDLATSAANAIAGTNGVTLTDTGTGTQTGIVGGWSNGATGTVAAGAMKITAGDWDCSGTTNFNVTTSATTTTFYQGAMVNGSSFGSALTTQIHVPSGSVTTGTNTSINDPLFNTDQNNAVTIQMLANWNSGAGVINMGGSERCRRMR